MESSIETFFHNNIIFPNDVKRRLNTIGTLDKKLQEKREELDDIRGKIKGLKTAGSTGSTVEEHLLNELDRIYTGECSHKYLT